MRFAPPPPYAELHCLSAFSFLRGASEPAELMERAGTLGYEALAITDECSLAGVVRAHKQLRLMREAAEHAAKKAAEDAGTEAQPIPALPRLLIGSEFLVRDDAGQPRFKLVLIAQNLHGYGNLSQFITRLRRASPVKGEYTLHWRQIAPEKLADCLALLVLPRDASDAGLAAPAHWALRHFAGRAWIAAELLREAGDAAWLQRLQALSEDTALPLVAAGDVHFHVRSRKALQDVMTATRLGRPVAECGFDLQPNAERHLRSRQRIAQICPAGLMAETLNVAARCTFRLDEISYRYPSEVVPAGLTANRHLRMLTYEGAARRWPDGLADKWRDRIEHELELIEDLRYEHYFLTVADTVAFARSQQILCQGRGSAANSVVCYCLGITSVDPQESTLLFERFISRERGEPPDIDVDFEHERRELVIQHLYAKYGRDRAALTAVVICYRPKSAIRDVGKALGFSDAQLALMSKDHSGWPGQVLPENHRAALLQQPGLLGVHEDDPRLQQLVTLGRQLNGLPRHLSQHVGGFVLTEGPLERLVPIENATMQGRSVIEWDKDDIDELKMMKVDVLALGMLTAIKRCFDLLQPIRGKAYELATIPQDDTPTYDMICAADTIGVFQIESRAQMSMLPRLRPRNYYDLVVEVAIVRPGPIEGGMVHPYLQNRAKSENDIDYPKGLKDALWRTRGVPIFQEQVMQIAMLAAGFTAGEADELRRAMASWKRPGVLEKYYDKVVLGMRKNGYEDEFAERIFRQIKGFSSYGFPESHAASFALLTYVSSWLKCHEPAAFLCALLNSQPLGFYTPSQLVQDARRHHVEVRAIDVNHSDKDSRLELRGGEHHPAVRLGLRLVSGLGDDAAERIETARARGGEFAHPQDLALRARLTQQDMQQLAAADALTSLAGHRRQQVWQASALHAMPALLQGSLLPEDELELPAAAEGEEVLWDYAATGLTLRRHPLALLRPRLAKQGLLSARQLDGLRSGRRAKACGIVTGRQKPQTAKGTLFVTLEDETGNVQVIVWNKVYEAHRSTILGARLLAVEGIWQRGDGDVRHLLAQQFTNLNPLLGRLPTESRDFR
ncbi:error-prone DNA polymerase [Pelomonas aquatica]|uniref:error-prone DNA polymerase n=1 Tax=Pelomonas aquatica TaxID=431058 RepID=UPI00227A1981|nr:error-prone DNA polymerase [Pelomonas aquatica]MCY4754021.1 error-prone DNA polymerase [Pelomonas aquatica]